MSGEENGQLFHWVSDSLHDVLGFSDSATAEYVLNLAKTMTRSKLVQRLINDADIPSEKIPVAESFASELVRKINGGASSSCGSQSLARNSSRNASESALEDEVIKAKRKRERNKRLLDQMRAADTNTSYELLESDEDEGEGAQSAGRGSKQEKQETQTGAAGDSQRKAA